ncbi:amidase [Rathayibacter sp. VKM Ac-2803]|uniref:amidase n=1 Tax=Rathayibacter sp. VKM Ac-2803 TaxID=2609256 RepID=UPI00135C08FF|nr:amidase [Rathayibacter sp. VKM Ac-2803]MWV51016.1 amidase [Rathayibacter sp. VKM Ac-2803]
MTPATRTAPSRFDGARLAAGYESGELSPVEVTEEILADIAVRNPAINAFSDLDPALALAAARASEQRWRSGEQRGPVDGVPVTVKENLYRAGLPARAGTAAAAATVPTHDSPAVARLNEAGAVILGSTTMPDWGMLSSGVSSAHGITRSPIDPALTVGGSSSGAGAAAAAGFGTFHVGTDIGGSVRLPAAWLGLATLKPSDGRIPLDNPYQGRAAGPLAQSVADVALGMSVLSRPDARDYTSLPPETIDWNDLDLDMRGRRVAVHVDPGAGMPVDPEIRAAVLAAADAWSDAGAEVVELPAFIDDGVLEQVDLFWRVRFWRTYYELPTEAKARALPFITTWVHGGADVSGRRVLEATEAISELRRRTVEATLPFDAVLSPVAPVAAFPAEWPMPWGHEDRGMAHIAFTLPYNMSGQPAASINAGTTSDGRAIALQISGRRFADLEVLRQAAWWEAARPASAVQAFPAG